MTHVSREFWLLKAEYVFLSSPTNGTLNSHGALSQWKAPILWFIRVGAERRYGAREPFSWLFSWNTFRACILSQRCIVCYRIEITPPITFYFAPTWCSREACYLAVTLPWMTLWPGKTMWLLRAVWQPRLITLRPCQLRSVEYVDYASQSTSTSLTTSSPFDQ